MSPQRRAHDLPLAHSLIQPGRTVCVVFRASPLIWPTFLAQPMRPGPSLCVTPEVFTWRGYGCFSPLPLGEGLGVRAYTRLSLKDL